MLFRRNLLWCIVLSLLTCGIYSIFWWIALYNDFARANRMNQSGTMFFVLTVLTCGIYGLIWFYKFGQQIELAGGKNDGTLYIVLYCLGFGLVSLALIQLQENDLCDKNLF